MSLRVLHWNANGLRGKAEILYDLLEEKDIDVALVNETHLGPSNKIDFPGYEIYREDVSCTKKKCRGLAVVVNEDISYAAIPPQGLVSMYELGVKVNMDGAQLRLFAAYRPPQDSFDVNDVRALLSSSIPTIIAGDMNAKHKAWNSSTNCIVGERLNDDAKKKGYTVRGPREPTFYPSQVGRSPDVLDIVIHSGLPDRPITQKVLDVQESDHRPVLLHVRLD